MKRLGISHDVAHCQGLGCKGTREQCIRYILHKEAEELGMQYVSYVSPPGRGPDCPMFWKLNISSK